MLSDMAVELEGHVVCQVCHLKPVIGSSTVHIPWHDMRPYSQFWLDYSYGFTHLSARLWCLQSGVPLVLWLILRWSLIRIYIVHVRHAGSAIEFIAKSTEKTRPQRTWQKPWSGLGTYLCTLEMGSRTYIWGNRPPTSFVQHHFVLRTTTERYTGPTLRTFV
jgi:hypothetical protein